MNKELQAKIRVLATEERDELGNTMLDWVDEALKDTNTRDSFHKGVRYGINLATGIFVGGYIDKDGKRRWTE